MLYNAETFDQVVTRLANDRTLFAKVRNEEDLDIGEYDAGEVLKAVCRICPQLSDVFLTLYWSEDSL